MLATCLYSVRSVVSLKSLLEFQNLSCIVTKTSFITVGSRNSGGNKRMAEANANPAESGGISSSGEDRNKCIFCKIVDGKEDNEIFYQDDEIVVFQDIRPAAKHHLLVVPRQHIRDCKSLVPSQLGLLERLIQVGNQVLQEQIEKNGGNANEVQKIMGFHWPPFHTVSHLHLHVIAPSNEMGFIARTIFRPSSLWFVTADYVRDRLQKMPTS